MWGNLFLLPLERGKKYPACALNQKCDFKMSIYFFEKCKIINDKGSDFM